MQNEADRELEARVDDLLSGSLPPDGREELLLRIARDERARDVLRGAIELRRRARAAFGYDGADEAIAASLAETIRSLDADGTARPAGPSTGGPGRPRRRARRLRLSWLAAAAVALLATVAGYVAVQLHGDNRELRRRLAGVAGPPDLPGLTEAQRRDYRRMWSMVVEDANGPAPWVLLSKQGGEFGYLPQTAEPLQERRLVLLRCVLTEAGGRAVGTVNLLIPAGRCLWLSVPEAGELAGRPVSCEVATSDESATVGLRVGEQRVGNVGVSGRVEIGEGWVEIGQFLLDGQRMRVTVQALPLGGALG